MDVDKNIAAPLPTPHSSSSIITKNKSMNDDMFARRVSSPHFLPAQENDSKYQSISAHSINSSLSMNNYTLDKLQWKQTYQRLLTFGFTAQSAMATTRIFLNDQRHHHTSGTLDSLVRFTSSLLIQMIVEGKNMQEMFMPDFLSSVENDLHTRRLAFNPGFHRIRNPKANKEKLKQYKDLEFIPIWHLELCARFQQTKWRTLAEAVVLFLTDIYIPSWLLIRCLFMPFPTHEQIYRSNVTQTSQVYWLVNETRYCVTMKSCQTKTQQLAADHPTYIWSCVLPDNESLLAADVNTLGVMLAGRLKEKHMIESDIEFNDVSLRLNNDHTPLLHSIRPTIMHMLSYFLVCMTQGKATSAYCDLALRQFVLYFSHQEDAKSFQPFLHGIDCQVMDGKCHH